MNLETIPWLNICEPKIDCDQNVNSDLSKTQIVSVLFLDIVGYSQRMVADQASIKHHFNASLASALEPISPDGRMVLDTGDGAAVAFLQNPEDALATSDRLSALVVQTSGKQLYSLRSGIHFGPAMIVKDVNGFGNLVGDGINDAQRVMGFAGENEVFASRTYAEMLGRISESIACRFVAVPPQKDKHGRLHQLVRVVPADYKVETIVPLAPSTGGVKSKSASRNYWPIVVITTVGVIAIALWQFRSALLPQPSNVPASSNEAVVPAIPKPVSAPSPEKKMAAEPNKIDTTVPSPAPPPEKKVTKEVANANKPNAPTDEAPKSKLVSRQPPGETVVKRPQPISAQSEENVSPCPECNCTDLLTKISLGVALSRVEQAHLKAKCR